MHNSHCLPFAPLLSFIVFSLLTTPTSAQVTLEEWTEVFGTIDDQQLGKSITGIAPSVNLPYRAAVSRIDVTGLYTLLDSADTEPQLTLPGENPLVGDLNSDGWTDIVVGTDVNGFDTVVVYWGTATGIDTMATLKIPGEEQYSAFRPSFIGDINNDGYLDLINVDHSHGLAEGKLYFYYGPLLSQNPDTVLVGDSTLSRLGGNIGLADLNSDDLNDLVVRGWYNAGPMSDWYDYINIYFGAGSDTLDLTIDLQLRGYPLISSGLNAFDLNGDTIDDLLWTNRDTDDVIYVHYGGIDFDTIPSLRLANPLPGIANFGWAIQNAGDMNGDGYQDVVTGCPGATITSGFVIVFGGGPLIDEEYDAAVGMSNEGRFGETVASIGDVTGDGLAEIIVGAPRWPFFQDKGYWGIFKGDSEIGVTDVDVNQNEMPEEFWLGAAYPNPFNPSTTIEYGLPLQALVNIKVYDLLGREVKKLISKEQSPGRYSVHFDGSQLSSGVYAYEMIVTTTSGRQIMRGGKMMLLK